jgi:hypothetical protein
MPVDQFYNLIYIREVLIFIDNIVTICYKKSNVEETVFFIDKG